MKLSTRLVLGASLALLASGASSQTSVPEIRDAILGVGQPTQDQLTDSDVNTDGQLDVSDIIFLLKGGEVPLDGFTWVVTATFGSDQTEGAFFRRSYDVALKVTNNTAVVTELDQLNPTAGLLDQALSQSGQLPGANRPDYALSAAIPVGTTFTVSDTAQGFQLTSQAVNIAAGDETNPTGRTLTKTWVLTVSTADVFSDAQDHGAVTETIAGFLPNGDSSTTGGRLYWTRFSPNDLVPLE